MINSIVCFKWVVNEKDIELDRETRKLDLKQADYKISDNDKNAIEAAILIKEQYGGKVEAITIGTSFDRRCMKDALSRGPEGLYFVTAPDLINPEPSVISSILAKVISKLPIDLIFCGVASDDYYAQQVGPQLSARLGIPCLTYVSELQVIKEKRCIIAKRKLDNEVEVVSAMLPALVTVLPDINEPRTPKLVDILDAGEKEITEIKAHELGVSFTPTLRTTDIVAANMERKCLKFTSDLKDIRTVVNRVMQEGIID